MEWDEVQTVVDMKKNRVTAVVHLVLAVIFQPRICCRDKPEKICVDDKYKRTEHADRLPYARRRKPHCDGSFCFDRQHQTRVVNI